MGASFGGGFLFDHDAQALVSSREELTHIDNGIADYASDLSRLQLLDVAQVDHLTLRGRQGGHVAPEEVVGVHGLLVGRKRFAVLGLAGRESFEFLGGGRVDQGDGQRFSAPQHIAAGVAGHRQKPRAKMLVACKFPLAAAQFRESVLRNILGRLGRLEQAAGEAKHCVAMIAHSLFDELPVAHESPPFSVVSARRCLWDPDPQ